MSNQPDPPASVTAFGAAYHCGHCDSETGEITRDAIGVWHVQIRHDSSCPVLGGKVSAASAGLDAALAALDAKPCGRRGSRGRGRGRGGTK